MAPSWVRLGVISSWTLSLAVLASNPDLLRQNELDRRLGDEGATVVSGRRRASTAGEGLEARAQENIVFREGIAFQTEGCPQVISEEEAFARANNDSIPGNTITLVSEAKGRTGNHFMVVSSFLAMAYCCRTKVLTLPGIDHAFPPAGSGDSAFFETDKQFFDFSGVERMPLAEHEGLSKNPLVCKPHFEQGGQNAFLLRQIHADLLSCMNRVYVRGCEAAYLEPIFGAESYSYCTKPAATNDRRLSENSWKQDAAAAATTTAIPSLTGSTNVATSEKGQKVSVTAGAGARAFGSASRRTSSRKGQSDSVRDNGDHNRVQRSRVGDSATEEDRSNKHRSDGVASRDAQASVLDEAVIDGHRGLRAAADDGGSSAGSEPKLGLKGTRFDKDDHDILVGSPSSLGRRGGAGSLVIHIRSGDIFHYLGSSTKPRRDFLSYGQPPLQFYLWAIASQPWSDVTILTFCSKPEELNPTFAALEMLQQTGFLGLNVTTHKDRDLLTDIRSMLCADGLAISRSTLHFLTFAHTRAKHLIVPSKCGPGSYARGQGDMRRQHEPKKKPNPNNTTLLCIENPDTEVYGVSWKIDEASYSLYDNWDASPAQQRDMVLFDGVTGLSRCCVR